MLIPASPIPLEEPTLPNLPELDDDTGKGAIPSYVKQLAAAPFDPAAAAMSRHEGLAKLVDELEARSARLETDDPAAKAAQQALQERVRLLGLICDGLETVVLVAAREGALEGPLAPYLAGTYLWLDAVAGALIPLTGAQQDWAAFRSALMEVSWLYEMSAEEQARLEARGMVNGSELGMCLAYVCGGLMRFKTSIDASFA